EQLDNLHGQLTILKSGFDEAAISIGTALIPAIKLVTSFVQRLTNWFNSLSERTKSFIAIGAAVSSILLIVGGGLLMLIGFIPSIVAGFAALKTAVIAVGGALGTLGAPVWAVIAVIGSLIAAVVLAWNK